MTDADLQQALDGWLPGLTRAGDFSGVVLVARGYGDANQDGHVPNTPDVRYNIGSINKAFTHVAILQLIDSGKLKLTDTIGALLPDDPNEGGRVSARSTADTVTIQVVLPRHDVGLGPACA